MAKEKNKLIPFTEELEKAIEEDAARCRRPFVRQVEAVLLTYYGLADVELNESSLQMIGEIAPRSAKKTPVIGLQDDAKNKKRA